MELKGKAQAEVVVAVVRRVVVAVSYTAVPGVVVPASAPVHAVGAHTDTVPYSVYILSIASESAP